MKTLYRKLNKPALMSLLSFALIHTNANAAVTTTQSSNILSMPPGMYLSVFGGGGSDNDTNASQNGTAFFSPASGGPLAVHAAGDAHANAAIVGMNIGYQWAKCWMLGRNNSAWLIRPAAEIEGYYLKSTMYGSLTNPTPRLPEHDFDDSFPMKNGVILANGVFTFKNPYASWVDPYVGAGIGAGYITIWGSNSKQVRPAEPGINHFNSNPNDTDWAFAAQVKAGLRFNLSDHWHLFGEYRFLYLSSTEYTFGATKYPTHVPTTRWSVNIGNMGYNMGAAGIEYSA